MFFTEHCNAYEKITTGNQKQWSSRTVIYNFEKTLQKTYSSEGFKNL